MMIKSRWIFVLSLLLSTLIVSASNAAASGVPKILLTLASKTASYIVLNVNGTHFLPNELVAGYECGPNPTSQYSCDYGLGKEQGPLPFTSADSSGAFQLQVKIYSNDSWDNGNTQGTCDAPSNPNCAVLILPYNFNASSPVKGQAFSNFNYASISTVHTPVLTPFEKEALLFTESHVGNWGSVQITLSTHKEAKGTLLGFFVMPAVWTKLASQGCSYNFFFSPKKLYFLPNTSRYSNQCGPAPSRIPAASHQIVQSVNYGTKQLQSFVAYVSPKPHASAAAMRACKNSLKSWIIWAVQNQNNIGDYETIQFYSNRLTNYDYSSAPLSRWIVEQSVVYEINGVPDSSLTQECNQLEWSGTDLTAIPGP